MTADTTTETGGTYTLLLVREEPGDIAVGALGTYRFPAGAFAYVGSALGTGGFARVDRHRRVAAGDHDTRHWHIDYLMGDEHTRLASVITTDGADAECRVATGIRDRLSEFDSESTPIAGFGASDCGCRTHLLAHESLDELQTIVCEAHDSV